jgi:DNA-binding NarL/FixJ family response regulator
MAQPAANLRILIVADDPLVRAGLATLLADHPNLTVIGRVASEVDLPAQLDVYHPDVIVFDLGWDPHLTPTSARLGSDSVSARTSLESLAELRETGLPIVALLPDESYTAEAWTAGARGLLLRNTDTEKLQAALLAVSQGLVALDPALTTAALPSPETEPPRLAEALTPRELEVLQLLAEGLANKTIARRLDISDHTVKFHVNAILSKLGAQSRTDAVVRATRLGLILL